MIFENFLINVLFSLCAVLGSFLQTGSDMNAASEPAGMYLPCGCKKFYPTIGVDKLNSIRIF